MLIKIKHGIFRSNFVYACMSPFSNHLLGISATGRAQLVKILMLKILEPHGRPIFWIKLSYLFFYTVQPILWKEVTRLR